MPNAFLLLKVCRQFLAFVAFSSFLPSIGNADDMQSEKELISAISESQLKRERLYDNGHFVWLETNTAGDEVTQTHYEYWANSGKHFRLDSYTLNGGMPAGNVRRLISTPNDTTLVIAKSILDPGTIAASTSSGICKNGSCPPSPASISGQFFVAHANRYATVQVKDIIQRWADKSWNLTDLEFAQNDANACVLTFTREKPEGTRKSTVALDPVDFRVQSWTYEFLGKNGKQHAMQNSVLVYGGVNPEIPSEEHSVAYGNLTPIDRSNLKLIEFDLEPAELDLFQLPSDDG